MLATRYLYGRYTLSQLKAFTINIGPFDLFPLILSCPYGMRIPLVCSSADVRLTTHRVLRGFTLRLSHDLEMVLKFLRHSMPCNEKSLCRD